jgi:hypothetical protein
MNSYYGVGNVLYNVLGCHTLAHALISQYIIFSLTAIKKVFFFFFLFNIFVEMVLGVDT